MPWALRASRSILPLASFEAPAHEAAGGYGSTTVTAGKQNLIFSLFQQIAENAPRELSCGGSSGITDSLTCSGLDSRALLGRRLRR